MSFSCLGTYEVALPNKQCLCQLQVFREFSEMHEMCPPNCPLWPLETNSKIGIFAALPENKLNSETEKRSRETIGEK